VRNVSYDSDFRRLGLPEEGCHGIKKDGMENIDLTGTVSIIDNLQDITN